MKHIIHILPFFAFASAFGQFASPSLHPGTDPQHWGTPVENWDFKTMTSTELVNTWYLFPTNGISQIIQEDGASQPAFTESDNITISSAGLSLKIEEETQYDQVNPYLPDTEIMVDGYPNLRQEDYTDSWMKSHHTLKYGYIEGRMKIPYGFNFHSGFWTFKAFSGAANAAEIDIYEMVPSHYPSNPPFPYNNVVQKTNVHLCYDPCSDPNRNEDCIISDYTQYHTYGLEWSPVKIIWYFDNGPIRILDNPGVNDAIQAILNFSLKPIFPGETVNESLTPIPSEVMVDYVRWYKLRMNCTPLNVCAYNFATHVPEVRSSITIGGSACVNSTAVSSNVVLRAETTQITGTFTVPVGATFAIIAEECVQ